MKLESRALIPPGGEVCVVGPAQTNLIKCQIVCYSYSWSRRLDLFAPYLTPLWKTTLGREKWGIIWCGRAWRLEMKWNVYSSNYAVEWKTVLHIFWIFSFNLTSFNAHWLCSVTVIGEEHVLIYSWSLPLWLFLIQVCARQEDNR